MWAILLLAFPWLTLALTNYVGTLDSRVVLPCGPPRASALPSHLGWDGDSGRVTVTAGSADVRLVMLFEVGNSTTPSSTGYTVHGIDLDISIHDASLLWSSTGNYTRQNSSCGRVAPLQSTLTSSCSAVTGSFEPEHAAFSVTGQIGSPGAATNITFDMSFRGTWDPTSVPLARAAARPGSTASETSSPGAAYSPSQNLSRLIRPTSTSTPPDRKGANTAATAAVTSASLHFVETRSSTLPTQAPSAFWSNASTVRSAPPTKILPIVIDGEGSLLLTAVPPASHAEQATASGSVVDALCSSKGGQIIRLPTITITTISTTHANSPSTFPSVYTNSSRFHSGLVTSTRLSSTNTIQTNSSTTSSTPTSSTTSGNGTSSATSTTSSANTSSAVSTTASTNTSSATNTTSIPSTSYQSSANTHSSATSSIGPLSPTSPSNPASSEPQAISTGTIVGVAIGSTTAVAVIAVAALYLWRRHRQRRHAHQRTGSSGQRLMGSPRPEIIVLRPVSGEDERQSRSGSDPSSSMRRSHNASRRDPSPFVDKLGSDTPLARESGSHLHSSLNFAEAFGDLEPNVV